MSNLNKKLIERELKKLEEAEEFSFRQYAECFEMICSMQDDVSFSDYVSRLRLIYRKKRDEIV